MRAMLAHSPELSCASKALNEGGHHIQVKGLVDRMVDVDGELWWKIRWRGYSAADDTWETSGSTFTRVCTYRVLTVCTPARPQGNLHSGQHM